MLKDGVAERYVAGRNVSASPYRFELDVEPEVWFLEDEGYELAVFHSHLSSPPRPSRTDVENIGLWQGRPYLILTVRTGELAAFRIEDGQIARSCADDRLVVVVGALHRRRRPARMTERDPRAARGTPSHP